MPDKAKIQTEIEFLSALENGEAVTQMSLAKRVSVSVGLVNALLRRATQKGLIKVKAAPYKRYAYYLTPRGLAEKSRLVTEYLEVSLDFFRRAREEYVALFGRVKACGEEKVILVGQGELVEIALLAAREVDIEVLGLLDHEVDTERLYGLPVFRSLTELSHQGILVITASRHPQEAFDQMAGQCGQRRILAPPLLRIVPRADGSC